ncbi:MAG: tyrosine-type recombinase/integrase [Oscillospiraceae bacterium]|nr:tyrosine-type recombinase/integrase [Oscillospiraceae bacterium]
MASTMSKAGNLHATRHTFATEALQKTTDIITVSEILGHAKPSTTLDMYGHTFDDRKRALMEQM